MSERLVRTLKRLAKAVLDRWMTRDLAIGKTSPSFWTGFSAS